MVTAKQRLAAENVLENIRSDKPKTIGVILKESGYSDTISTTPTAVTQSKGFLQVLEEAGVTDDKLSQVMEEGLSAEREGKPDHAIRHKYLETAIKVKGHIKTDNNGDTYNTFVQQNNINPNAVDAKELVEDTLSVLMEKTKMAQ